MTNPREAPTNAADFAPGVDDGRQGATAPPLDTKPRGRRTVFWIVAASLAILVIVFMTRPYGEPSNRDLIGPATTHEDIAASPAEGKSPAPPAQPAQ